MNAQETGSVAGLNNTLTPPACREDLQILQASFEEGHAGYDRYVSIAYLHGLFETFEQRCYVPKQAWEFFKMVSTISASIKDGHTRTRFSDLVEKSIDDKLELLPFFVIVDGREAVVYRDLGEPAGKFNGMVLQSVNGIEVTRILEELRLTTPVDGDILSAKDRRIEGWAFVRGLATTLGITSPYAVTMINSRGKVLKYVLGGTTLRNIETRFEQQEGKLHPSPAGLAFYQNRSVAVLKIRQFGGKLDPRLGRNFPTFFRNTFEEIRKFKTRSIILDLRGNRGGETELGPLLLSYLIDSPIKYYESTSVKPVAAKYLDVPKNFVELLKEDGLTRASDGSFHSNEPEMVLPSEPAFHGNIYVLQDGLSFSVTADFVALLRETQKATFIGEESGGASGGNTSGWDGIVVLPNSRLIVRVPLVAYHNAIDPRFPPARGVFADHSVGMSI
ncbi:MAG: S41 family peptidase [Pyrinomonadaceae bacterium]